MFILTTLCVPNAKSYERIGSSLKLKSISRKWYGTHGSDGNVFFVTKLNLLWLKFICNSINLHQK